MRKLGVLLILLLPAPGWGQSQALPRGAKPGCFLAGTVVSGSFLLPGVAITATEADRSVVVTSSTGIDGAYAVPLPGPGRYQVETDLTAFSAFSGEVTVDASCHARLDITLTLASHSQALPLPSSTATPQAKDATPIAPRTATLARAGLAPPGVPAGPVADATQQDLGTQPDAAREAEVAAAQLSLPPGFSIDTSADTVTASGSAGQVNPFLIFAATGEGGPPGMRGGEMGMPGDPMGGGRSDGFGGIPGAAVFGGGRGGMSGGPGGTGDGRGGGPGGNPGGGAQLAGRLMMAGRMQNNRPRGQVTYTLGGSALDAAPYPLGGPSAEPNYLQQRFGGSVGGPLKIPGLFDSGPRTSFFLNYSGNHGSTLHDSYATVPTPTVRGGDFSASSTLIIDPLTGQPFPGYRIPADRISPAAQALLRYYPLPNLDGATKNYHYAASIVRHADDINVRLIRTFATPQRPGQRPGGAGGTGGARGGMGGGMNLSLGLHYSRSTGDQAGVFPTTAGSTKTTAWDVPINFNFTKWSVMSALRFQFNRRHASTFSQYAFGTNVAGDAGIQGVSQDPFSWGVPGLSFSTYTSMRDLNPSERIDQTITVALTQTRVRGKQTLRWGGDFRAVKNDARVDSNPRGSFIFTGLYASGAAALGIRSGFDFADFLLGYAQQATVSYGPGKTQYRSRAWSLFFLDDWRVRSGFTLNAGVRYEYLSPTWEAHNRLVNLDVTPDFTAAAAVIAGETGPYSGLFPASGFEPDRNNLSPRVGFAWKPRPKITVRGGYGISYSSPTYATIAQNMAAQPPFAVTDTRLGALYVPLPVTTVFAMPSPVATTNNFGVDRHYRLGHLQLWNLDVQRDMTRTINVGIGYTGTKGGNLDLQRAPNRGPAGPRIPGVQPFIWETSGGRSIMHALSLRVRKRPTRGLGGSVNYTWSRSMDDASTLGGSGAVVAQDDENLAAEWGLSSFDQRHRMTGSVNVDLPFGPNRHWLNTDTLGAKILGGWVWASSVTWSSGTPFTARILGSPLDVGTGTNGTLRADSTGVPIALDNPTILRFFNTAAFGLPPAGQFGNAGRNTITGPRSFDVSMGLNKSIMLGGSRSLNVRVQASNVFNMAQFGSIDTVVNSPTFGQVTSMRAMRSVQIALRAAF